MDLDDTIPICQKLSPGMIMKESPTQDVEEEPAQTSAQSGTDTQSTLDASPDSSKHPHGDHKHFLAGWRFKALIITIILSVVGYFLFSLWGGWNDVLRATNEVGFKGFAVAITLSLVNYALRFIRWDAFLKVLGQNQIPFIPNLRIYLAGFALTTTPGKAGEAFRSVFLIDYNVTYRKSFGAFLSERLSDLIAVVILAACGLILYKKAWPIVLLTGIAIVLVLLAIQKDSWLKALENYAKKILPARFAHLAEFLIETIMAFRSCYEPKILLYGIFLGVLAWGAEGLAFWYLMHLLNLNINLFTALFIYSFSLLVGAISFLPGGLGSAEVVMMQLMILNGAPASEAVAATIVIRLTTLWFSVFLGLIAMPKLNITTHHPNS